MNRLLALALVVALLIGLVFAWWPRYWAVAIAVSALSLAGGAAALLTGEIYFDWRFIPVVLIGLWTPAQLIRGTSILPVLSDREAVYWGECSLGFILASQILQRRSARDLFLKAMLAASLVLAVMAVIQKYAFPRSVFGLFPAQESVFGTFYYENQFAALMELSAPIALWRILKGHAVFGGISYAVLFGATLVSASRAGSVLVLLELVMFIVAALFARRLTLLNVGLILAMLVIAGLVMGTDIIQSRFEGRASEQVRLDLDKSTVQMIRQRPFFGTGMGSWRPIYPRFATFDIALTANEAHNDWLQWSAEGGVLFSALIALVALSLAGLVARSVWGIGFLIVLVHSLVDYVLREPALALLWFVIGGAVLASGASPQSDLRKANFKAE